MAINRRLRNGVLVITVLIFLIAAQTALADSESGDNDTKTPIKHVIIIIGENRTFDHVFATYKPTPRIKS